MRVVDSPVDFSLRVFPGFTKFHMALKILMGRCTSESEVAPSADVESALWGHLPAIGHPQFAGASHGAEVAARAAV